MHVAENKPLQRAGESETSKLHKIYDFRETKGPPEGGPFLCVAELLPVENFLYLVTEAQRAGHADDLL